MAGNKAAGWALGVLLAVAALLAAAAMAADDDQTWKCFRSCTKACHDDDAAASKDGPSGDANVSAVSGECKSGCQDDECFADLPPLGYPQCVYTACLSYPRHKREIKVCLKNCCEKCFRHGPPAPSPSPEPPSPPAPGPAPEPPSPPN